jgi:hypothetical protein
MLFLHKTTYLACANIHKEVWQVLARLADIPQAVLLGLARLADIHQPVLLGLARLADIRQPANLFCSDSPTFTKGHF